MDILMRRLILLASLIVGCTSVFADTLTLKSGHPDSYVVQKGDTLWDISASFLKDPWRWPKLWGVNPQVANPHLIYPGDRLTIVFIDGEPRLVVKPHVRKSPQGRISAKGGAIPAIDLSLIQPYLLQHRVVDADWFEQQPKVMGGESPSNFHVVNDIIYVQGELTIGDKFGVYLDGRTFKNSDGDNLGLEVILSASGRVVESGAISKVELLSSLRETASGYRLLPIEDDLLMSAYFMPRAAELAEPATVLASGKNIREMGKLDVVYLDRGAVDGLETGHVFSIFKDGEVVVIDGDGIPVQPHDRNRYEKVLANISSDSAVKMPDLYRGKLMVFKVFDKTSMGIILVNERPVRVADKLAIPDSLLRSE
ncbi:MULTISPECIES: LysM peptidoglycan-binding domain-containing protein [unclassified Shewanella]|uniref:LysM peptidoglycan-binding domain-containing protein n=1 Tax=unclassified Shewanella TaxID=196818 RepID=UPI001BB9614B|nr:MULTISPECIES: LysM peptidoglycan-binding domain-containing protein [unclassified Shewanella]GIU17364.1 peptidoglycan-binding protein LysM [Shewanella sp. MBTL60-112-B1]GIU36451.1 peptidoglycan-binding protein LysM [Shewanella sp. MBTL60-112-B2]